jgi:hypothetical protein
MFVSIFTFIVNDSVCGVACTETKKGKDYLVCIKFFDGAFFFSGKKNQKPRRAKNSLRGWFFFLAVQLIIMVSALLPLLLPLADGRSRQSGAQTV